MRVRLVTMQKNEDLVLEPWLRYHGALFGFENLTVIDNGSADDHVKTILSQYEQVGVQVVRKFTSARDFEAKGEIVASIIRGWDEADRYDFVFPVDCDEFVGLWQDGRISCSRTRITNYLRLIHGHRGPYRVETNLFNLPGEPGWYWPQDATKTFFAAGTLRALDHGYHFGKTRFGDDYLASDITYFHFHNKPYDKYIAGAKNKLRPFVDVDDPAAVAAYGGPGGHLKDTIINGEAFYHASFADRLRLHIPSFGLLMRALGIVGPLFSESARSAAVPELAVSSSRFDTLGPSGFSIFDPVQYRSKWLDVATEGFDPLLHYIRIGRGEGRTLP